jgi:Protein of unknown function (DUF2934)
VTAGLTMNIFSLVEELALASVMVSWVALASRWPTINSRSQTRLLYYQRRFRLDTVCDTDIAGGDPMPAPARGKALQNETLSLEERVRLRAYELYVQRGNRGGSELDDWLQAEEQVRRAQERAIDESSLESFPASNPPAH